MGTALRSYCAVCLDRSHLARTTAIALVVGTWLTLYNQGGVLLAGGAGQALWLKVALNYLTPFAVSNWGLLSRQGHH